MSLSRIRISSEATNKLRFLKARTGLTPNILCRLAFTLSLNESGLPSPESYDEQGQEFNRYTLMGEWDQLFFALLKERLLLDGLDVVQDLAAQFAGHLNRGVSLLYTRLKTLNDLQELIPTNKMQLVRETSNLDEEATLA